MTTLYEVAEALIQARVVSLGIVVHTHHDCGHWHAWDDNTYDGSPAHLGTSPRSEREAIIELLDKLEDT